MNLKKHPGFEEQASGFPVFFQPWEVLRGFVLESERKTNHKKWIYWRWHPFVAHRGLVHSRWSSKFSASMFCWSSWILPISSHLVSVRGWFTRASLCLGRGEKVCQVVQMPFAFDDLVIQNLGFGTVFLLATFKYLRVVVVFFCDPKDLLLGDASCWYLFVGFFLWLYCFPRRGRAKGRFPCADTAS